MTEYFDVAATGRLAYGTLEGNVQRPGSVDAWTLRYLRLRRSRYVLRKTSPIAFEG